MIIRLVSLSIFGRCHTLFPRVRLVRRAYTKNYIHLRDIQIRSWELMRDCRVHVKSTKVFIFVRSFFFPSQSVLHQIRKVLDKQAKRRDTLGTLRKKKKYIKLNCNMVCAHKHKQKSTKKFCSEFLYCERRNVRYLDSTTFGENNNNNNNGDDYYYISICETRNNCHVTWNNTVCVTLRRWFFFRVGGTHHPQAYTSSQHRACINTIEIWGCSLVGFLHFFTCNLCSLFLPMRYPMNRMICFVFFFSLE